MLPRLRGPGAGAVLDAPQRADQLLPDAGQPGGGEGLPARRHRAGFLRGCGFVFNRALDPLLTEYSDRYEPTQAYSPTFQRFHRDLAGRLAGALDLRGKTVVEVGLRAGRVPPPALRPRAAAAGIGFDPCLDRRRADVVGERARDVELIGDFFSDSSIEGLTADVLLSKMTLGAHPGGGRFCRAGARRWRGTRRRACGCSSRSPKASASSATSPSRTSTTSTATTSPRCSLAGLFRRHGFAVEEVTREYDGQYLTSSAAMAATLPDAGTGGRGGGCGAAPRW